jgi:antitoxin (DNA-binding transcriptional repressor) of toxin-antitoxin stability system
LTRCTSDDKLSNMAPIVISATKARNDIFNILDQVKLGREYVVRKDGEEVALISPKNKKGTDLKALKKAMDAVHGTWTEKDYQEWKNSPARKSAKSVLLRRVGKVWLNG